MATPPGSWCSARPHGSSRPLTSTDTAISGRSPSTRSPHSPSSGARRRKIWRLCWSSRAVLSCTKVPHTTALPQSTTAPWPTRRGRPPAPTHSRCRCRPRPPTRSTPTPPSGWAIPASWQRGTIRKRRLFSQSVPATSRFLRMCWLCTRSSTRPTRHRTSSRLSWRWPPHPRSHRTWWSSPHLCSSNAPPATRPCSRPSPVGRRSTMRDRRRCICWICLVRTCR
mmetsp:Transcript_36550/g.91505  ORF Transcript_36550/g.91505 Transcript_36550/m.91505 type:complete len:224 (-) Transcript_36550:1465-2136(-)